MDVSKPQADYFTFKPSLLQFLAVFRLSLKTAVNIIYG